MYMQFSHFAKSICLLLVCVFTFTSCASFVVIAKPYDQKLRIGDGVKLLMKDGTVHSGRITYLDRASVVIRTPKQKSAERPVQIAQFGSTIPWAEVVEVKVAGTLDHQHKLISNEEIRINRRTNHRRNMAANVGLLGIAISFLGAGYLQDRISPANTDLTHSKHGQGRAAFWSTLVLGSIGSIVLGYKFGRYMDDRVSIERIERARIKAAQVAQALADSIRKQKEAPLGTQMTPLFPSK